VFDRTQAGKTCKQVLGFGGASPVVGDSEGLRLGATAVLIGIAPMGGQLPANGGLARTALERGLEIWSGCTRSSARPELGARAGAGGGSRRAEATANLPVADGLAAEAMHTVVTRGIDCNVGKMTPRSSCETP